MQQRSSFFWENVLSFLPHGSPTLLAPTGCSSPILLSSPTVTGHQNSCVTQAEPVSIPVIFYTGRLPAKIRELNLPVGTLDAMCKELI